MMVLMWRAKDGFLVILTRAFSPLVVVGAVLEESHCEKIGRDRVEGLVGESEIKNVLIGDVAGDLAQDLVGKMRYVRVGHDRSV